MKIIIDTNLWVSFTIGKRLSALKSLLTNARVEIYVCRELLCEYRDVVGRPKLRKYITTEDVAATLEVMSLYCYEVSIGKRAAASSIRDVKDLYLLSLAETIEADYIVSGDKDLLVLKEYNGTRILDFNTFISLKFPADG